MAEPVTVVLERSWFNPYGRYLQPAEQTATATLGAPVPPRPAARRLRTSSTTTERLFNGLYPLDAGLNRV